jgi:ribulose-phosphate 3-epimerase
VGWREWTREGAVVEPSIYAADFAKLGKQVGELLAAGARILHFDVGDGHFISEITIGPIVLRSIADLVHDAGGVLDCHLMVTEPESQFENVKEAGGDSVTFHVEAVDDPSRAIGGARDLGLGVGVAFNPETPVEVAAAAAANADLALCMSIHPGLSGQKFMPNAFERISRLRSLSAPDQLIQVDGGISTANARQACEAGADLLVAGSAVFWQDDPAAAYRELAAVAREALV